MNTFFTEVPVVASGFSTLNGCFLSYIVTQKLAWKILGLYAM